MSKFKLRTVEKKSTSTISFPRGIERACDAGAKRTTMSPGRETPGAPKPWGP